jgi:hypothetical protein
MSTTPPPPSGPESLGNLWVEISIPLTVFTGFIVGIRIWWRLKQTRNIGRADICVLVSLVITLPW